MLDDESQTSIKKYYHQVDRVRKYVSRMGRESRLTCCRRTHRQTPSAIANERERRISTCHEVCEDASWQTVYCTFPAHVAKGVETVTLVGQATSLESPVGYNVTHDNGVVAMAFSSGTDLYPDPPAYRVGIDVMLLQLPKRDSFPGFVEIFSEQVSACPKKPQMMMRRLTLLL